MIRVKDCILQGVASGKEHRGLHLSIEKCYDPYNLLANFCEANQCYKNIPLNL